MRKAIFVWMVLAAPLVRAQAPQYLGPGHTTAFSIDRDGDGCGTGVRSNGVYGPIGVINASNGATTATYMDTPDADDLDPTVCSTAQWRAKWMVAGLSNLPGAAETAAICAFLQVRHGFTNCSRVAYLAPGGNDSTGQFGNSAYPFATVPGIYNAGFRDFQGGVIVVRGGTYTNLTFTPAGAQISGSSGHPVYVIAYPGELVVDNIGAGVGVLMPSFGSAPQYNYGWITLDGLVIYQTTYEYGDSGNTSNYATIEYDTYVTIRNCEFAGGGKIFWGNHSWYGTVEWSVIHDSGGHAVYIGEALGAACCGGVHYEPIDQAIDFNYAGDEAAFSPGAYIGTTQYITIQHNVVYNVGEAGFGPFHTHAIMQHILFDSNIVTVSGGSAVDLTEGVAYSQVSNNIFLDSGRQSVVIAGDGGPRDGQGNPEVGSVNEHHLYILNNTFLSGKPSDVIFGVNPGVSIYADLTYLLHDVYIENNIFGTYNLSNEQPMIEALTNSQPNTWTVENNWFYDFSGTQTASTNWAMTVSSDAVPGNPGAAGSYTVSQICPVTGTCSGNQFGSPGFTAANSAWTFTPQYFNLMVQPGSGAIGAGMADGIATDFRGYGRAGALDIGAYASSPVIPSPPSITTASLPGATVGLPYSTSLAAAGDAPITWSVIQGSLPAWASWIGASGTISGNVLVPGTNTFMAWASSASGGDVKTFTLTGTQAGTLRGVAIRDTVVH